MALRGRRGSTLLVAGVALLAAAAAFDAVRGDPEAAPSGNEVVPAGTDAALAERLRPAAAGLRDAGVRGVLTFADERCRVRALTLPSLTVNPAPDRPCYTPPGSAEGVIDPDVPQPGGVMVARCRGGAVEIWWREGKIAGPTSGCAPAWKPNGTLTAVRDGAVIEYVPLPERGRLLQHVVLGRDDLTRAVRAASPGVPAGSQAGVEAVAWFSDSRFAAIIQGARGFGAPQDELLGIFERGRLVWHAWCCRYDVAQLRVSPSRRFVAARADDEIMVVDRGGRTISLPLDRETGRAVAWSPDERWLAVATDAAVAFVPLRGGVPVGPPAGSVPLRARELSWR